MKRNSLFLTALILLLPAWSQAQNNGTGIQPFGSYTQTGFDTINNQNLNTIINIPMVASAGRGLPLNLPLTYNSQIYSMGGSAIPVSNFGWTWDMPPGGQSAYDSSSGPDKCYKPGYPLFTNITTYQGYRYTDALGTTHSFPNITWTYIQCGNTWSGTGTGYASDASGYYMTTFNGTSVSVRGPGGQQFPNSNTAVDANGNYVSRNVKSTTETDWTDSTGNVAVKILYTPNNTNPTQIQYQFLDGTASGGVPNYKTIILTFQNLSVKTKFLCSNGVTDYTGTATVPQELDIPTPAGGKLKYIFSYESYTANNITYYTGRLQKVTLPTGGSYEYDYPGANDGINCSDGSALTMNRIVNDGTNSATWKFVRNLTNLTTTETTPQLADTANASDTVFTFNSSGKEMSRQLYADSPGATLLRTINTTWAANGTPATQITTLEDNSTKVETDSSYDSNGLLGSLVEYDWGSGAHGSANPIRTTTYSYQTSSVYTNRNIINLVTSKVIADSAGTVQYRQDTTYDGTALANCPKNISQHDDTNYSCTMIYRGNPTAVTTYLSPASSGNGITKNFTYDWFGNLLTAQLNCCTNKTWTYSATTQYSQADSITSGSSPTQLSTTLTYNLYNGQVVTATDDNGLTTTFDYDFLRRPTSVSLSNGVTTGTSITHSYDDVNFKSTTMSVVDSSRSVKTITTANPFGQTLTTTLEDASSIVYSIVKNGINLAGRNYQNSNPYTTTPAYWTSTSFDALGRPTTVTLQDNSKTKYSYVTNTTTITDPVGKARKSVSDAAGRITSIYEPDVTNGNLLTQQTSYTYNVFDELLGVTQGSQTRTYAYDALGRPTKTITPEGGSTCFGTVSGGNCTSTNAYDNYNNLLQRTDARGVLTSYAYDGLNRLTGVSYNVGTSGVAATPSAAVTYGASGCSTAHGAGCVGQIIAMTDGIGSENYTYNNLEKETLLQKVVGTATYSTQYLYNQSGGLIQTTYPSMRVVTENTDALGRLCSVGSTGSTCTTGTTFATGISYNSAQQVTAFNYGNSVSVSLGYSADRLQVASLSYAKSGTTLFGSTYSYGTAGSNNGQVAGITDLVDNGRTASYTYDGLGRLSTASTVGSTGYPAWGLSWTYDRYGNSTNQTQTKGSPPYYNLTVSASTNHITGTPFSYDANGNMTNDGYNTLAYDAENRTLSATNGSTGGTYSYDGNNLRVKKVAGSTTTVYILSGGKVIAEYDNGAAVGSPSREYVYAGSTLLAKIVGTTTTYYHHDQLSNRLVTSSSGTSIEQIGHYPFGESWYNSSGDKLMFTSYERDTESGNDYAKARYYASRLGRFLGLDPISGSVSDPQSLNHFAYVENDPINAADPSGQCIPSTAYLGGGVVQGFQCPPTSDFYDSGAGSVTYIDMIFGPIAGFLNYNFQTGTYDKSSTYNPETTGFTFSYVTFSVIDSFSNLNAAGGYSVADGGSIVSAAIQKFKTFLETKFSKDCVNALNFALGGNSLEKLALAADTTTFFDVNQIASEPAVNYFGQDGMMTVGNSFSHIGSTALTVTGNGGGFTQGIYSRGGIFAFANSPYLLAHELTHIVQGMLGGNNNLDFALTQKLGIPATPNTASGVVSDFFNSGCAGFQQK
jgi:RHS repeat-associated protein